MLKNIQLQALFSNQNLQGEWSGDNLEQLDVGIRKEDVYKRQHVSQRLLHRARGNVPTAESRKEVLYVRDMSGKYLDHFQFSVYKGCLLYTSRCV